MRGNYRGSRFIALDDVAAACGLITADIVDSRYFNILNDNPLEIARLLEQSH